MPNNSTNKNINCILNTTTVLNTESTRTKIIATSKTASASSSPPQNLQSTKKNSKIPNNVIGGRRLKSVTVSKKYINSKSQNNFTTQLSQMPLATCAGCEMPILDQYLYNVLDRPWHQTCIQCNDCKLSLNEKCFSREGKLFCKDDFFR